MSVNANEQEIPDNNGADNGQPPVSEGHPAWKEILDVLPDSLHELVTPTLKKWDDGVQQKFQEIHQQYDPYKPFIDNKVDPVQLQQAQGLLEQMEADPNSVIASAIEHFGLDFVSKAALDQLQQQQTPNDPDDFGLDDGIGDISNHPIVKAMQESLNELTNTVKGDREKEAQQTAAQQFEQTLEALKTEHGDFDKMYVTALMSQGVDGAEAVKQYHNTVNQAAAQLAGQQVNTSQTQQTPVIMGGDGVTGSGIPQAAVKMGDLKSGDVNKLVAEMLKRTEET